MKTYHIGLAKQGRTLVIEARHSVDYLSCELYDYLGQREITKATLYANRHGVLQWAKAWKPEVYGKLTKAIVD